MFIRVVRFIFVVYLTCNCPRGSDNGHGQPICRPSWTRLSHSFLKILLSNYDKKSKTCVLPLHEHIVHDVWFQLLAGIGFWCPIGRIMMSTTVFEFSHTTHWVLERAESLKSMTLHVFRHWWWSFRKRNTTITFSSLTVNASLFSLSFHSL